MAYYNTTACYDISTASLDTYHRIYYCHHGLALVKDPEHQRRFDARHAQISWLYSDLEFIDPELVNWEREPAPPPAQRHLNTHTIKSWVSASDLASILPNAKSTTWSGWMRPSDILDIDKNPVSLLNELHQRELLAKPVWSHDKQIWRTGKGNIWVIKLTVNDDRLEKMVFDGEGVTKKVAQTEAAREVIKHIAMLHIGAEEESEEELKKDKGEETEEVPKMKTGIEMSRAPKLIDRGIRFDEDFVKRLAALRA